MSTQSSSHVGIGLAGALFLIFLVLKLTEVGAVAHWSWWWVTSPLWLPFVVVISIFALAAPFIITFIAFASWRKRRSALRDFDDLC